MSYIHPYQDAEFVLRNLVDFDGLCESSGLEDVNLDLASAVLEEAGKLGAEVLAPLNNQGDLQGATMTDAGVQETPGFKDAYLQFAESGWLSLSAEEEFGGQNLPNVLSTAVNEIWHSANMAFALCPMLTQGAMESIAHHGSDELKAAYLPSMAAGEWTGTMNLTEPDAGSDLAAIKAKAVPADDHYLISGQKIFITWGDHQMTENIVHLVLARLPDAPAGVKGISLFVVPKYLDEAAAQAGQVNNAEALSLEHKLGIHGSPTCVMEFNEAKGFIVGEPNNGLAYMFTMMNHARQTVGLQGLSISERAYQLALQYARERLQGTRRDGSLIPIIEHPDVRRMLMVMKSSIEAMRAVALVAAAEVDHSRYAKDETTKAQHFARLELFTPIVKGWLTEMSQEITSLGVQIHGGMGFIEETGAAQHYRDARILTIYEGTTGIQALDFIGRKMLVNQGEHLADLLNEMSATEAKLKETGFASIATDYFSQAIRRGSDVRQWLLDNCATDKKLAGSASVNFLMSFGYLSGAWLMLESAMKAQQQLDAGEGDQSFLSAKVTSAQFYCEHVLPRTEGLMSAILAGSDSVMALSDEQFG